MNLTNIYEGMADILWLISFPARMCLLIALALCFRRVFRYREQLITILTAVPFFLSAWCLFILSPDLVFDDDLSTHPSIIGLLVISMITFIGLLLSAWQVEGRWNSHSEHDVLVYPGRGLMILGFFYPFYSDGILGVIFGPPVGILLQPAILFVGGMLIAGFPNVARFPMLCIIVASFALGIFDYFHEISTWYIPLMPGLILGGLLLHSTIKAGGALEDDRPPIDVAVEEKRKAVFRSKTKEKKTWKLK